MKWINLTTSEYLVTDGAEVNKGIVLREQCFSGKNVTVALCFVPDCRIITGGCGERAKIAHRTETR